MTSKYYTSIIDREKGSVNITNKTLGTAARSVLMSYSESSLKKGSTYIDYKSLANRCAYIYRYSSLHTGIVTKYFRKLSRKRDVKNILSSKRNIKICCLGGGPGSDIVGICTALAVNPSYNGRITQVSILDICQGWENSFEYIMSDLLDGKVKGIPDNFINKGKFKKELVEVDLLGPLSENTAKIISNADIICMVKFVSVILSNGQSEVVLKRLSDLFKDGAIVFFVDNFKGNVYESVSNIFKQMGLQMSIGSVCETFTRPSKADKGSDALHNAMQNFLLLAG